MNGQSSIALLRKTNEAFADLIRNLSVEQINAIPVGFNNNIIWNFAHSLAMQQEYFYRLSHLPYIVEETFVNRYKKGMKPEGELSEEDIKAITKLFSGAIDRFEEDYKKGIFKSYQFYATSIGFAITNIEEAIQVALFHDGWHFGVARTLKKLV